MFSKVILVGRLGGDPEINSVGRGKTEVCNLSVALSRRYQDRDGDWQEETDWIKIGSFNENFIAAAERCGKGDMVLVEGILKTESFKTKKGEEVSRLAVLAFTIKKLVDNNKDNDDEDEEEPRRGRRSSGTKRRATGSKTRSRKKAEPEEDEDDELDDDIPF